MILEYLSFLDL